MSIRLRKDQTLRKIDTSMFGVCWKFDNKGVVHDIQVYPLGGWDGERLRKAGQRGS